MECLLKLCFMFSYLSKKWNELDEINLPAFIKIDEDGKRTLLSSLKADNPFKGILVGSTFQLYSV